MSSLEVEWESEPLSREPSWASAGVYLSLWYSAKLGLVLGWVHKLPPGQVTLQSTFQKDMGNACRLGIAAPWPTLQLR